MKPIRVLMANRPRLMRELMVATISEQPDIEIVGEVQDADGGIKVIDIADPFGNLVGLIENPNFRTDKVQ